MVGERGFEPLTPWSRKWGAGRPPVVSQISPEGPQVIKGLGIEVWDGHWLIYRIGGPQFLESALMYASETHPVRGEPKTR